MSSQIHSDTLYALAWKRKAYLRTKANAYAQVVATTVTTIGMLLLFIFGFSFVWQKMLALDAIGALALFVCCVPLPLFVLILGMGGASAGAKAARSITYVPPVAEQLAALRADEILLRGSDAPVTAPAELLRAAQPGAASDVQELLQARGRDVQ